MKHLLGSSLLMLLVIFGCSPEPRKVTEGRVVYAIDYPNQRDNFFLYSILPKEMELDFKDGRMESRIQKANLKNILLVDCNKKHVAAYFEYGDEAVHVTLTPKDVSQMVADQKNYHIRFTNERDTMAGFNVKKAIATAVEDPSDQITLWYTTEIQLNHSNWYNPFKEVPGFLLAYAIDRYGIRMEFRVKRFEDVEITNSQLQPEQKGKRILYKEYNQKLGELFQSFE